MLDIVIKFAVWFYRSVQVVVANHGRTVGIKIEDRAAADQDFPDPDIGRPIEVLSQAVFSNADPDVGIFRHERRIVTWSDL